MNKRNILYFLFLLIGSSTISQNLSGVRIFINPGHGGYDSDDRNVKVASFGVGEEADFWESKSNLDKGLQLLSMVQNAGGTAFISRTTNTTEDDLPLSQIVRMANESEADFMLSIHSNAGGKANYILQLYAGKDPDDTYVYPTSTPYSEEGRVITTIIANNQYTNKANVWGNKPTVRGDKTFGRTAMGWSDGYGVLRGLVVPGTISEGSMHDYCPETLRLMNMEYKWLESWHFFKSFCNYFNGGEISVGNIVGTIHDSRNKNQATYDKISNSKDELLALNRVMVTLNPGNLSYQTDNYNNGFYAFKNLQPGKYTVKYEIEGYYSQEQQIEVLSNETAYNNVFLDMVRSTPPAIVSYTPSTGDEVPVECVTPVVLNFNWDIDEASAIEAFSITPQIEGSLSFEDSNHRIIFTPSIPYETSTIYHVKVDKSLKHRGGMTMVDDFEFSFLTEDRNRLVLIASYPNNIVNKVHYSKQRLSFVFDRILNSGVSPDNIKIYDKNGQEVSQNIRSRLNNKYPSPLGSYSFQMLADFDQGATYDVSIGGGLVDTQGIPFFTVQTIPFETIDVRETSIPVHFDFETLGLITYNADAENNVVSASANRTSSQKLFDSYSYEFTYTFGNQPEGRVNYIFSTSDIRLNNRKKLGIHILGDLTGNELWIELQTGMDIQTLKFSEFNSTGWEYKELSLSTLDADKEYILKGFEVRKKETSLTPTGQFYMDNLLVGENTDSGISDTHSESIHIYPNPASEWIYLNKYAELSLYSLTGFPLKSALGDKLYVGDIMPGSYLLHVGIGDKKAIYPILITNTSF